MVAIQNKLYKVDTLDMGRGAFQALCDSKGVDVVRSGTTFAVSAFFPVLSLSHMVDRWSHFSKDNLLNCNLESVFADYQAWTKRRQGGSKVKLVLPSVEASQIVSIDRAIGLGGGSHEVGHIICDLAGKDLNPATAQKIIPVFKEFVEKKYNLFKVLGLWSNVCADIRLEKMMSKLYPESEVRFHSIQEWVWNDLESKSRLSGQMAQNPANCIALMIRDLGKDHKSKSQQRVFNEYATLYPNLWQVALSVKPLWEQLQVSIKEYTTFKKKADIETEIEKTVHLPLTIAMQILMALEMPKQEKNPQPPQEKNPEPNDPNDDQDQPNDDQEDDCNGGQGGEDQDEESDQPNDGQNDQPSDDDQDQDNQDQSDDQDQDQSDDSDDDQDSQDQDNQDQDDQDQDDQDQDNQDQSDDDEADDQDQSDDDQSDDQDQDQSDDSDDDQDQDQDNQDQDNQDQDDQDQDSDDDGQDQDDQDSADQPSDDGIGDDFSDDYNQSEDQDQDTTSPHSSFDENTELNLEDQIDANDIAKAFQKQFDKLAKNLKHLPYISNGLKIVDLVE